MRTVLSYRGVYLACLLYHGDKVLVTSDDQLPVVEVDENFSGPSVNADLHWLMKVLQDKIHNQETLPKKYFTRMEK